MKYYPILLIMVSLAAGCRNHSQSKKDRTDTIVRSIQISADTNAVFRGKPLQNSLIEKVQQINMIPFTDSVYLENEAFMEEVPDGGASLTGYFNYDHELVKINEWLGLSYGIIQRSFYFENGRLIEVAESEDDFYVNEKTGTDHSKFDQHFSRTSYFDEGKLVTTSSTGRKRLGEDDGVYQELLVSSEYYYKLLLSKRKKQ